MKNMLTLESFADWCEKQPEEKLYEWGSKRHCAIAQYASALGNRDLYEKISNLPVHAGSCETLAFDPPHTFGALAKRLRAAQ